MDRRRPHADVAQAGPFIPPFVWSGGTVTWGKDEPPRLAHSGDLLITFGFRCNLACTFCLVEDGLDTLRGIRPETFAAWLSRPELFRGVSRITLSGGEATLEPELLEYVAIAREVPGVEHVRIQTNGMRLADRGYLRRLIDAGVDEYFVSVHGWDEPSMARITQRKGAFAGIVAGLEAVAASGATLMTNTCIVPDNFAHLTDIIELVAPLRPAQVSLWNQFPRLDNPARRKLMARVGEVQPHLIRALDRCDALGLKALVKWFPRCLLGAHRAKQDDDQPTTLVEPDFWPAVPQFSCFWSGVCADAQRGCGGLAHPYIEEFGWEEAILPPTPQTEAPARGATSLALSAAEVARAEQLAGHLGLPELASALGWQLGEWSRRVEPQQRGPDRLRVELGKVQPGGLALRVWLEWSPDPTAPGLVQTASFSVSHGKLEGPMDPGLAALLGQVKKLWPGRDPGGLRLPWWRG